MSIPSHLILSIVLFGPGIIACYIFIKKIQQNRSKLKEPLDSEEPIILPGHSHLEKIEKTHVEIADKIVFLIFPTLTHALVFFVFFESRCANEWTFVFLFGIETGIIALLGFKLWRLLKELQQHRLDYRDEIYVSQILQPLTLMGFKVFHDIEFLDHKIDHVLINDSGVFCLETETPDRPKHFKKKDVNEVTYDGHFLHFPWGQESSSLKNLQRNSSILVKFLYDKTGERIPVYPLLLLPGWRINKTGKGTINVINPREIPAALFYFQKFPMSEKLIDKIEMILSEKCMEKLRVTKITS